MNGLKPVNDNLGHAAGDELLVGAASCLFAAVGAYGKVYRTGGDEFMVVAHTRDPDLLMEEIRRKTAAWRGRLVERVSVSLGCASHAEHPDASIEELERRADERMYEDKKAFYRQPGQDRRQR